MTDETPRETEDEQPEVEGHKLGGGGSPEPSKAWAEDGQEQDEPEVEGHFNYFSPVQKAAGPEKSLGPERAG